VRAKFSTLQWLRVIIANRPENRNIGLLTIDDIQNGLLGTDTLHNQCFDPRLVVVLKTPNIMLETTDVPPRHERNIEPMVSYPSDRRYTLQWIAAPPTAATLEHFPNNSDATFANQELAKPADLLLHYNYGAAVVKHWGKNKDVLTKRLDIPRPPVPSPVPMGPIPEKHNHRGSIAKRVITGVKSKFRTSGRSAGGAAGDLEDSEQVKWDEDDIMLFFWGNTKAARERRAQKERERTEYLEDWRAGVATEGNPM